MGTPLSVAAYAGRVGKHYLPGLPVMASSAAMARTAFLESENKSLSRQIEALVTELDRIKQSRRKSLAKITVPQVLDAVALFYDMPHVLICGHSRIVTVIRPRHVVYYIAHNMTGASSAQIGEQLGRRDHTTVLHGIRVIAEKRRTDPQLNSDIVRIIAELDRT